MMTDSSLAAELEVKLRAPNGTNVTVKGKQGFDSVTTASVGSTDKLFQLAWTHRLTKIYFTGGGQAHPQASR